MQNPQNIILIIPMYSQTIFSPFFSESLSLTLHNFIINPLLKKIWY